jgi:hypothetical protein
VKIPSLDLQCAVWASDPDHHEAGPILFCDRASTKGSRIVVVSRYHIKVTDESGSDGATDDRAP